MIAGDVIFLFIRELVLGKKGKTKEMKIEVAESVKKELGAIKDAMMVETNASIDNAVERITAAIERYLGQCSANAVVGDDGEVDFKEDAKFAQHLKEALQISYRKNGIPALLSCLNREDRWHSIVYTLLQLWNDIEDTFDVTPENQKAIIQSAGAKWRQFKATLNADHVIPYIGQKKKLMKPPKQYAFVGKEAWRHFVALRTTEEWKAELLPSLLACALKYFEARNNVFRINGMTLCISLEDVLFLTGLPISGSPVISHENRDPEGFSREFGLEDISSHSITKMSSIAKNLNCDEAMRKKAVLLLIVRCFIVPSANGHTLNTTFLKMVQDFKLVDSFAWGAVL
ncbi:hypothetical protein POM88_010336 [Heracleum sosnowskyi]|uniref:Aminotransferase-like plant mobile domain-containing protein n=1 Tax=Heracleum sosnowskyi TaxID=360622 RepID=A0AAD8ISY6_9APIA|nr:hypothetical protein POM88_010336 [Heracleum sosnowskyi]